MNPFSRRNLRRDADKKDVLGAISRLQSTDELERLYFNTPGHSDPAVNNAFLEKWKELKRGEDEKWRREEERKRYASRYVEQRILNVYI